MTRRFAYLAAAGSLALIAGSAHAAPLVVTPAPAKVEAAQGTFRLTTATPVVAASPQAQAAADRLIDLLSRTRGMKLTHTSADKPGAVVFELAPDARPESYTLTITPQGVRARGDAAGLYYAATSLWQMAQAAPGKGPADLAAVTIEDAPRFSWRGLMLDSARHFQSVTYVKSLIDEMALYKLNTLHWHLTDDQGWRVEIKKHPNLTKTGAWRVPAGAGQRDIDPATGKARLYGGYYTQDQIREVVAYAAARHITIVPEIDVPGHATAAIASYPALGVAKPAPTTPSSDWGVLPNLYNVDDATFAFLEDVLGEVIDLFPGPYIHVGGDEAIKDQWKADPAVQAKIKALGLADEHALQSWFIQRLEKYVSGKGRRLIGWDEILEGGLPPGTTVMSWRGVDGAVAAAKQGHDTVLSPHPTLYLDHRQGDAPDGPTGRGNLSTLRDIYSFDPAPKQMTADERKHVLGVQGNVWAEHLRTEAKIDTAVFPRIAALAETAWTAEDKRDWNGFSQRLPAELARLRSLNIRHDETALQPQVALTPTASGIEAVLTQPSGVGQLRYAVNGPVTDKSPLYTAPLTLKSGAKLSAAAFMDGAPLTPAKTWTADAWTSRARVSQQLKTCTNRLAINLEDDEPIKGPRRAFLVDIMDPCWIYPAASLDGAREVRIEVGKVPFNFQLAADRAKLVLRQPRTPKGELELRIGGCTGEPVAVLPLAPADRDGTTVLTANIPPTTGRQDLCINYTAADPDPLWVIGKVQIVPPGAGKRGG